MLGVVLSVAGAAVTVVIVLVAVALVFVPPRKVAAFMRSARALGLRTSRALDVVVFLPALAVQVPTERVSRILPRPGSGRSPAAGGGGTTTLSGVGPARARADRGADRGGSQGAWSNGAPGRWGSARAKFPGRGRSDARGANRYARKG